MNAPVRYIGAVVRKIAGTDASSLLMQSLKGSASGIVSHFEDMGRDAILDIVGASTPLGTALKAALRYADMTSKEFQRTQRGDRKKEKREDKPRTAAQKRRQAQRHREWLNDNRWRFDWRSQPRRPAGTTAGGEWMEGRLDYQAEVKKPFSRSVIRRRTRALREYKARAGGKTRIVRTAWGDF